MSDMTAAATEASLAALADTARYNGGMEVCLAVLELLRAHRGDWPPAVLREVEAHAEAAVAVLKARARVPL